MRYELSRANVIIADGRLNKYWAKGFIRKPGQAYFQISHEGGLGPKKIGADVHNSNLYRLQQDKVDAQRTVVLLSGSKWESENLTSSYYYWRQPTEWGHPRNDVLVNPGKLCEEVRERLGIESGKRIVLYAPTHRDWEGAKKLPELDPAETVAALKKRFGGEWIMLVRRPPQEKGMHWLLPGENSPLVRDVTDYPDTAELLVTADVLISDYSTCAFDYLLTRKPVFLYAPDEESYAEHHGLYYPLKDAPMPVAQSLDELLNTIEVFEEHDYRTGVDRFLEKRGNKDDGNACKRTVDCIVTKTLPLPLPDLTDTRKKIRKEFWKSFLEFFYSKKILNIDYQSYKIFGITFTSFRKPVPPKNPYASIPIVKNKIVFCPILRGFTCNPKYLVEEISKRKLPYDMVWVISPLDRHFLQTLHAFPQNLRVVVAGTEDEKMEISTAKIWINSTVRFEQYKSGIVKRPGQVYIQTWHASFGIKTPIKGWLREQKRWAKLSENQLDYLISNSDCESKYHLKPMFQFRGVKKIPILKLGHPRSDIFFSPNKEEIREKVYRELGIPLDRKLLLWAPTWRDDGDLSWISLDYAQLKESIKNRFGGTWEIAVRMHHLMYPFKNKLIPTNGGVFDASDFADIQELLVATDVLITDYSSCLCDFVLMRRPSFFYASDLEKYELLRGLAYPLRELPCPIAKTSDELAEKIEHFDAKLYQINLERYLRKMGCIEDGKATERFIKLIAHEISK